MAEAIGLVSPASLASPVNVVRGVAKASWGVMATRKQPTMTTIELTTPKHAAHLRQRPALQPPWRGQGPQAGDLRAPMKVTLDADEIAAYAKVCGFKRKCGCSIRRC